MLRIPTGALVALLVWPPTPSALSAQEAPRKSAAKPSAPDSARTPAAEEDALFLEAARGLDAAAVAKWQAQADALLAADPASRAGTVRRMALHLGAREVDQALAAYARWAAAAQRHDVGLLNRVASATLIQLDEVPNSETRARALEARARGGDDRARALLKERAAATPPTADAWHSTMALARLGDMGASREVIDAARQGQGSQRVARVAALGALTPTAEVVAALVEALRVEDPMIQGTAADVAGEIKAKDAAPALRQVMATSRFAAPLRAARALVRIGDPAGRPLLLESLASPLPDVRLLAASGLTGDRTAAWADAVEPIVEDENPLYRLQAAELLLGTRAKAATKVLQDALSDPNPVLREFAARVLATRTTTSLDVLRVALADASPDVRLHAAVAIGARAAEAARAR